MDEEEKEIKKRQEKINNWLKNPYNLVFLAVIIFAIGIRLYYFNMTMYQSAWWDEADYILHSKIIFGMESPLEDYKWMLERPSLIYIIFGSLFKIGLPDAGVRFIEVIFSLVGVLGVYLIGKEMFNRKAGLFAAFLQTVFWQDLFFTQRFMLGIPSMAFGLMGVYFFWKGYVKKELKRYWIYMGLFLGLSAMTRHTGFLFLIVIIFYMFAVERFRFLKQKDLWKALGIVIGLQAISVLSVLYFSKGNWESRYLFTEGSGLGGSLSNPMGISGFFQYFKMMFSTYFGSMVGWIIILSLVYAVVKLCLIGDVILKSKNYNKSRELFLILLILANLIFFGYFVNHVEPRYIMYAFPAIFLLLGSQLTGISKNTKNKKVMIAILLAVALILAFTQIKIADPILKNKAGSYLQVKESGYWIKANSNPEDFIISRSIPQHKIYSSRDVAWPANDTEQGMIDFIREKNPKYFVASIFESHQPWAYALPSKYPEIFTIVQAYALPENPERAALIIYEVNNKKLDSFEKNSTEIIKVEELS